MVLYIGEGPKTPLFNFEGRRDESRSPKIRVGLGLESHPHALGKIHSGRVGDWTQRETETERA